MTTAVLVLTHLLAAALGALAALGYSLFLMAAALWSQDDDGDTGTDPQPINPDPTPSKCKPLPSPSTATFSSSPAPAAPVAGSAPAASALTVAPLPTSVRLPQPPPASSATPASSVPAPAGLEGSIRIVLLDGPLDGLELRVATTAKPLTVQTYHGLHRYIPTDRHDLNRPVYLHTGPAPL